jgi:predicted dehydrogenase
VCASYRRLLANDRVQAVVVASPQFAHAGNTVKAAKAGKHVFCEKPMAVTLTVGASGSLARATSGPLVATEACQAAGVKLMIGQDGAG